MRDFAKLAAVLNGAHPRRGATRSFTKNGPMSAVRDRDLPKMPATLEVTIRLLRLGERERPIYHRAQAMHLDGAVHRLEIGAAPNADRPERDASAGQQ